MKMTVALLLCLTLCGVRSTTAFADTLPAPTAPDFYQWLDKYQNPPVHPQAHQPIQQPAAMSPAGDHETIQLIDPRAEDLSSPLDFPAFVDTSYEVVGPGEGLGCFYHRSYYSHLPLFKGSAYNLAGSLAVAEPAQVPASFPGASSVNAVR